jgi:hypothetical protein
MEACPFKELARVKSTALDSAPHEELNLATTG